MRKNAKKWLIIPIKIKMYKMNKTGTTFSYKNEKKPIYAIKVQIFVDFLPKLT